MEAKKVDLSKTYDALAGLNNAIAALESALDAKGKDISALLAAKDSVLEQKQKELEKIKKTSAKALDSMAAIVNKINNVLEQDGTGNDNN